MFKHIRRLTSESLIYGIFGAFSRFVQIFLVPVYTRIFAPSDYGVIGLVSSSQTVVAVFVILALDYSTYRWYWETDDVKDRKTTLASWAWCQFAFSTLFALLVAASSGWLGRTIVGRGDVAPIFLVVAISLPLTVMDKVIGTWFRLQSRPWAMVGYNVTGLVLNIAISLFLIVVLRMGVLGAFLGQLLARGATTLIAIAILRDWISPAHFRSRRLREMLVYAVPMIPSAIFYWVINLSDRYFVRYYTSISETGLYQVGYSIAMPLALLSIAFQQAWYPFSMSIRRQTGSREVFAKVFLIYVWVGCLASTSVSLFAPEILHVFTRPAYYGAATVVPFLTFAYLMDGLTHIAGIGPFIAKQTKPIGLAVGFAAALNTALNLLLIPRWGKEGAAISTLCAQALIPAYLFIRARKIYPIPYQFTNAAILLSFSWMLTWLGVGLVIKPLWLDLLAKGGILALFAPLLFAVRILTVSEGVRVIRRLTFREAI